MPKVTKYPHLNKGVYSLINKDSSILDLGCWTGILGKELIKSKHCTITGIDVNKNSLKIARKNGYKNIFLINLNDQNELNIGNEKYDYLIFADVLEHILYPEKVLRYYTNKNLKPNGKIIICLPNIAFIYYRLKILSGNFDYKEVGTMDKTHVKFYTLKTMKELINNAGLKIIKEIKYNEVKGVLSIFKFLSIFSPKLFTLQFIFLLEKSK